MTDSIEIQRLCSYITDDGAIAAYLGIPRSRVAKAREVVVGRKFKDGRMVVPRKMVGQEREEWSLRPEEAKAQKDAVAGCDELLIATSRAIQHYAKWWGVSYDDAVLYCANSAVPR